MPNETISHPGSIEVDVLDGTQKARIKKWKMRDRAELRPRIGKLFEKIMSLEGKTVDFSLAAVFLNAEEECSEIARLCVEFPYSDTKFDDLNWEDLPTIVQAVWTLNIVGPEGAGLVGKATGLLAPLLSSRMKTESKPSGPVSASLPVVGEQAPSA